MKVVTIGGGPAGLYFALLMKKADARHEVVVLERNRPDDTFGWGVVFSNQTLGNLRLADEESYRRITESFAHWDDIDVHVGGRTITSGGHGFSGIARKKLLQILQERAAELGVDLRFATDLPSPHALADLGLGDADVIVAADGVNSVTRRTHAGHFQPDLDVRTARFVWLGTTKLFDAFTFIFAQNEHGVFQVHAYRFDREHSAFIVECDEASWRGAGCDRMGEAETVAFCEGLFGEWLDGHPLMSNAAHLASPWLTFTRVVNERWHFQLPADGDGRAPHVVLVGDAAHTAHFSIGSGTKLAMEDGIVLARELNARECVGEALEAYEAERKLDAVRLQNAARNSMEWFENVKRYIGLEPEQFAYSLLTRSQRVSHENLRLRDNAYLGGVERWFAARSGVASEAAPPPMFTPFRLRGMTLANRIVVSPMDMYSADRRHTQRLPPRASRRAGAGRGRAGGDGDDVRLGPRAASPPAARGCTAPSTRRRGAAWSISCTAGRPRRSASSSAIRAARAPSAFPGKGATCRWRPTTGRSSAPPIIRTARAGRRRAR